MAREYFPIMEAVIATGLPRTTIVQLIDDEAFDTTTVGGRTNITRASFDAWYADYLLAQKSLTEVLTEGEDLATGVNDYLVATYKEIDEVVFTDIDDPARALNDSTEFYQAVTDASFALIP